MAASMGCSQSKLSSKRSNLRMRTRFRISGLGLFYRVPDIRFKAWGLLRFRVSEGMRRTLQGPEKAP